jgi:hypothetical protein
MTGKKILPFLLRKYSAMEPVLSTADQSYSTETFSGYQRSKSLVTTPPQKKNQKTKNKKKKNQN